MREFGSIAGFVEFLATRPAAMHAGQRQGEEVASRELVKVAQDMIGTEMREWPALAPSTVEEKQRLGYTGRISDTDPLYRTGELRASIAATVDQTGITLGSDDPTAAFHEFGTARMPARPFIGAAMFVEGKPASDTIAEHVSAALAGVPAREPDRRR